MPDIARVLKDEIQRIARREIKSALTGLRRDNLTLKRTVADMKRRLAMLESVNKRLVAKAETNRPEVADISPDEVKSARITGRMIRSIRSRLGLSQDAFAKLVGVSGPSVYLWERKQGRLDLRSDSKAACVSIRGLGKREAKQRLAEMAGKAQ